MAKFQERRKGSEIITAQEIADRLGLNVRTVYRHIEKGHLPYIAIGRYRKVPRKMFDEWFKENVVWPAKDGDVSGDQPSAADR